MRRTSFKAFDAPAVELALPEVVRRTEWHPHRRCVFAKAIDAPYPANQPTQPSSWSVRSSRIRNARIRSAIEGVLGQSECIPQTLPAQSPRIPPAIPRHSSASKIAGAGGVTSAQLAAAQAGCADAEPKTGKTRLRDGFCDRLAFISVNCPHDNSNRKPADGQRGIPRPGLCTLYLCISGISNLPGSFQFAKRS